MNETSRKNTIAFIWDLDGTLLDSYKQILPSLMQTLEDFNIHMDESEVLDKIIKGSVKDFFQDIKKEVGTSWENFRNVYKSYHHARNLDVEAAPHAIEILSWLKDQGVRNFVFTHRGESTHPILKNIGMDGYFEEIVTSEAGFPRKPAPDGNSYLVEKYHLNKATTYYVGDRSLDMESAENAGICKIFYQPSYSVASAPGIEDYVIHDFIELKDILKTIQGKC